MFNATLTIRPTAQYFRGPALVLASIAMISCNVVVAQHIIPNGSQRDSVQNYRNTNSRSGSSSSKKTPPGVYTFHLHSQGIVESNLVRLGDLVEISAPPAIKTRLSNLPLGPSPTVGENQRWTRNDILQMLVLRGYEESAFEFSGAQFSSVHRSPAGQSNSPAADKSKFNSSVRSTNANQRRPTGSGTRSDSTRPNAGSSKRDVQFTSAYVDSRSAIQAERNVTDALIAYLGVKTGQNTDWRISDLKIPQEFLDVLQRRKSIVGLAGGISPYSGEQSFTLLVRNRERESTFGVTAQIDLPPLIVAAGGPIRRDHLFSKDDLKLVPLPTNSRVKYEECYLSFDELIGRESSRAFSSGQPITKSNTRIPRVIDRGSVIKIEVVSGGISIQTNGRALEPGGLNELIIVEALPQRKKLLARVVDSGVVQVISSRTVR